MEIVWLEDYLTLAEMLNFSRAAKRRHVTQPAFSRRIRALEGWVGTPLFERTTHGVKLTPAGAFFYPKAEELVRTLRELCRETSEVANRQASALSVLATHVLSFTFVPRWIACNEKLIAIDNLKLISDSMQTCERMMLRGAAQFMLCHRHPEIQNQLDQKQFKSVVVGVDTLAPLSAPDRQGRPKWSFRGARPTRYLSYSEQSGLGRIVTALRNSKATEHTLPCLECLSLCTKWDRRLGLGVAD